jgi:hypothetical protein
MGDFARKSTMLITLRAILLTLFIAAPFGEHRSETNLQQVADDYVGDAVLTCPVAPGLRLELEHASVSPGSDGENA